MAMKKGILRIFCFVLVLDKSIIIATSAGNDDTTITTTNK